MSNLDLFIATVLICFGIVFYIVMLLLDTCNQKTAKKPTNLHHKILNKWIMVTLCISALISVLSFLHITPDLCEYINSKYNPPPAVISISLSLYQVCRFHYCLKSSYAKWLFIFLYCNGILILMYSYTIHIIGLHQMFENNKCILVTSKTAEFSIIIAGIWYYIWNLSVLALYVFKINAIKTSLKLQDTDVQKYNQLNQFLHKMVILELAITFVSIALMSLTFAISNQIDTFYYFEVFSTTRMTTDCFTMLLMAEHNNQIYQQFITVIVKTKVFCCCHKFLHKSISIDHSTAAIEMASHSTNATPTASNSSSITATNPSAKKVSSNSTNITSNTSKSGSVTVSNNSITKMST
eukprot:519730_1